MFSALRPARLAARQLVHSAASPPPLVLGLRFSSSDSLSTPPIPAAAATATPSSSATPTPTRPQKHKKNKTKAAQAAALASSVPRPPPQASASSPFSPAAAEPPLATFASLLELGLRGKSDKGGRPADGQAIALTTAESFDTPALLKTLQSLGLLQGDPENGLGPAMNLCGEAIYLPKWSPPDDDSQSGEVFLFENGSIVSWGLSPKGMEQFLRTVIRGRPRPFDKLGWVEQGRYETPETEVLDYWVGGGPTRLKGDAIHLSSSPCLPFSLRTDSASAAQTQPHKDLLSRLAYSAAMARVTKLGVYEEQFDSFAEGVAGIPALLESGSESPVKKHDIIKRVGTLHGFRQKLNLEDENLLDEPEFLWEDAGLHELYQSVCRTLEFETRLRILNDRVDYAFQLQSTLMELLNTKTSHRLEWIIILLIAFEIGIVLIREGHALLSGDSEETKKKDV